MARFDEAIMHAEKAVALDPLDISLNRSLGGIYLVGGHLDQAVDILQKTIEMEPDFPRAHHFLGLAYMRESMYEEAFEEFEKERQISAGRDPIAEVGAGIAYALLGKRDEAHEMLDSLMERSKKSYIPSSFPARLKLVLGETDEGFQLLEQAYEERDYWLPLLKVENLLGYFDLQSDPRYISLLKRMNLDK